MTLTVGKSITLDNLKKVIAFSDTNADGYTSYSEIMANNSVSKLGIAKDRKEKASKLLTLIQGNTKYAAFVPLVQNAINDANNQINTLNPIAANTGIVQNYFFAFAGMDTTTAAVDGYRRLTTGDADAIKTFIGTSETDDKVTVNQKVLRDMIISNVQQGDATAAGTFVTSNTDLLTTADEKLSETQLKDRVLSLNTAAANDSDTTIGARKARAALLGLLAGGNNAYSSNDYVNAASSDNDAGTLSGADLAFFKDADGKFNKASVLNAYYRNTDTAANVAQVINNINRDGVTLDQLNARVVDIAPRIKTLMDFVGANTGLVTQSDFGPIVNKIIAAVQRFRLLTEVVAPKLGKTAGTDVLTYNQATDSGVSGLIDANGKYIVG